MMNVATEAYIPVTLNAEWERIELLANGLLLLRQGKEMPEEWVDKLKRLQQQVEKGRGTHGLWAVAGLAGLDPLLYDILACAVVIEMQPRLTWLFQQLQPGVSQPYPTLALLQELLAFDSSEMPVLYTALSETSLLRAAHLIRMESTDPLQPIIPGPDLAARLFGLPLAEKAPPSSIRVKQRASWQDLVLPQDRITMLREFMLWLQHHEQVVGQWGGVEMGGPVALFAGPSGTGKTFAAAVLANELGWNLYRVDLGRLVSKYIGETEKNLNRLFDAAHGRPMILQFDEADSLFGKRGEIKDARDRYANLEVSHLLARIEEHRGPCILTSNLRTHLDTAFVRRFQMVIEFPRPDAQARQELWSRMIPPRAPREAELDPAFLGEAVSLSGGQIRNAALHAAYLAAGESKPIHLKHVATAVWRELNKDGREHMRSDIGALQAYLIENNHWSVHGTDY